MKPKEPTSLGMLTPDPDGGWFASLFADEEPYSKRKLWQLGTWAAAALGALALAFMTAQTSHTLRRDLANVTDIARQNRELANIVTERDSDTRRMASALDTLNADRDRLYARVTGLEQSLDSVTGAIKRQTALPAPFPYPSTAPPVIAVPETIAAAPSPELKAAEAAKQEPLPAAAVTAAIPPPAQVEATALPEIPAARTEFGIDLGTASSIEGLRALWRGIHASHKDVLSPLRPIVMVKERSGLGMQLRLVAGPITDAAAAARLCAVLGEKDRACEMSAFDGQRLAIATTDMEAAPAASPPAAAAPPQRRRATQPVKRAAPPPVQAAPPAPRPAQSSGLPSFFNRNN